MARNDSRWRPLNFSRFDESDHPRDDDGKFAPKDGKGSGKGKQGTTGKIVSEGWKGAGTSGSPYKKTGDDGRGIEVFRDKETGKWHVYVDAVGGGGMVHAGDYEKIGGAIRAAEDETSKPEAKPVRKKPASTSSGDQRTGPTVPKPAGRTMTDGTTQIDHEKYPKYLKGLQNAEIAYIVKDAGEAITANPLGEKAGYYADEINYAAMELNRRMKGGK